MTEAFLGASYDPVKLAAVEEEQISLQLEQAKLASEIEFNGLAVYTTQVNWLFRKSLERCERILGAADFRRLFQGSPEEIGDVLEPEAAVPEKSRSQREAGRSSAY